MDMNAICPFVRSVSTMNYIWEDKVNKISKDSRIFYILSGKGKIFIKDKFYDICENTFIMYGAGHEYRFYIDKKSNCRLICVNFDFNYDRSDITKPFNIISAGDDEKIEKVEIEPVVINDFSASKDLFKSLVNEFIAKTPYYEGKGSAILKNIIINAMRFLLNPVKEKSKNIARDIAEYIFSNYSSEITVKIIAEKFNYHPYYIGKIFKDFYNKSILEYLNDIRLSIADELIIHSDLPLDKIALNVGYVNYSHFSYLYKKKYGVTPKRR